MQRQTSIIEELGILIMGLFNMVIADDKKKKKKRKRCKWLNA